MWTGSVALQFFDQQSQQILLEQIDGRREENKVPRQDAMAGNPPAEAFQPSGIKGMIVMVETNNAIPPMAPSAPAFLFQKPAMMSAPNSHSQTPRNQLAPLMQNTGYIQKISGPLLMNGSKAWLRIRTISDIRTSGK